MIVTGSYQVFYLPSRAIHDCSAARTTRAIPVRDKCRDYDIVMIKADLR